MITATVKGPDWFFGVDACLEALAALAALLVFWQAYRIYKATKEKKYGYFAASFALLTLSFLSRSAADALIEGLFNVNVEQHAATIFIVGYLSHIILALIAYLILVAITYKITDKKIIALLLLTLLPSMLSKSYYLSFYGLSVIYLAFISMAYWKNWSAVRTKSACLVFWAFLLMTIAQIQFLLAVNTSVYVSAHITQAAGYVLLLFALIFTLFKKNEKVKTRHRV